MHVRLSLTSFLCLMLWSSGACAAEAGVLDSAPVAATSEDPEPSNEPLLGRVQVRRENVDRGTREETTRTFIRWDRFAWQGMLSLQLALPDEKTDFGGSPFDPRIGDSKARYRFAPFATGRTEMSWFIEATFPTADPRTLGSGKYQLSAGVTRNSWIGIAAAPELMYTAQLQQANSVAGDATAPNINYTKLDLSLKNTWGMNWAKAALNMRADWEQDGRTGAVGELHFGHRFSRDWTVWGMAGGLLWGEGVKGTYGTKVMIGVDRWF